MSRQYRTPVRTFAAYSCQSTVTTGHPVCEWRLPLGLNELSHISRETKC